VRARLAVPAALRLQPGDGRVAPPRPPGVPRPQVARQRGLRGRPLQLRGQVPRAAGEGAVSWHGEGALGVLVETTRSPDITQMTLYG